MVHAYQPESNLLCVKKRKERKSRFNKSADLFCTSNMIPTFSSYSEQANVKFPLSQGAFLRVYIYRETSGLVLKIGR